MKSVWGAFSLAISFTASSFATTLVIVTDQPKAAKAKEVATLFSSTPPYSLMTDFTVKVIQTSPTKLGCQSAAANAFDLIAATAQEADSNELLQRAESREHRAELLSPHAQPTTETALPPSCTNKDGVPTRLITCESEKTLAYIAAVKKNEGAKYAVIVKDDSRYGGSGGRSPVITTGSPATMAIHELMHRLGFADEYGYYTTCEADIYCVPDGAPDESMSPSGYGSYPFTAYNVSVFAEHAKYSSNANVRSVHAKNIPWLASIDAATDLTTAGHLGTPTPNKIGVYRAIVCDKASKLTETWQSTSQDTIMKTLGTTYVPKNYWKIIAKSLGTHIKP